LILSEPLSRAQISALSQCENLVSLKTEVENSNLTEETQSKKDKTASQLFEDFYFSRFGTQPSDELLKLFLELTEDE